MGYNKRRMNASIYVWPGSTKNNAVLAGPKFVQDGFSVLLDERDPDQPEGWVYPYDDESRARRWRSPTPQHNVLQEAPGSPQTPALSPTLARLEACRHLLRSLYSQHALSSHL